MRSRTLNQPELSHRFIGRLLMFDCHVAMSIAMGFWWSLSRAVKRGEQLKQTGFAGLVFLSKFNFHRWMRNRYEQIIICQQNEGESEQVFLFLFWFSAIWLAVVDLFLLLMHRHEYARTRTYVYLFLVLNFWPLLSPSFPFELIFFYFLIFSFYDCELVKIVENNQEEIGIGYETCLWALGHAIESIGSNQQRFYIN